MSYAKVRTDNLSGTILGKDLVSFKYQVTNGAVTTDTAIENGNVVLLGNLISGEREIHTASVPAANSPMGSIVLVASPEVVKSKPNNNLGDFRNEAGAICRGYILRTGDIFSVSAEAINITNAAHTVVELQATTKLKVVETLTSNSTQVGTIIAIEDGWYVIKVA